MQHPAALQEEAQFLGELDTEIQRSLLFKRDLTLLMVRRAPGSN